MRNIKLTLEYDGTNFCGWQIQPRERTVQAVLGNSLKTILHEDVVITASGRTDTGVHALGQVANFLTNSEIKTAKLKAALNGTLPKDVRISEIELVPIDFNSRFDAKKREYRYFITKRERAIGRDYCWCLKYDLDLPGMQDATRFLVGEHDFQSFCKINTEIAHFNCIIESIELNEKDDMITFKIIANRFLHNMVRIIVGTMIQVGQKKIEPAYLEDIIAAKDRRAAGQTAPAKGLFLYKIYY